ncbi:MAG TPA: hypothetical protein VHM25_16785 [Polyangiaceae bacterium]|jgi:hypothetical protein|nr:hypothetical protein [Polyangiaceae bacterium]
MFDFNQAAHDPSPVTPLPPIPEETPRTFPEPESPGVEHDPDEQQNPDDAPGAPDENPFPRVVPQPIATPEE